MTIVAGWADLREVPPVLGAYGLGGGRIGQVHPGADNCGRIGACLDECSTDDL